MNGVYSNQLEKAIMEDTEHKDAVVDNAFLPSVDSDDNNEIKIGMTFSCEEEAYDTYNLYACSKGFGIRRDKKYWVQNHVLSGRLFVCSCEGMSTILSPYEERKRERLEYRCGCKARIKYKVIDGSWKVVEFNDIHNHQMIDKKHRHFIRSARKVTVTAKKIISSLVDSGVGPKKAFKYMAKEACGFKNVGFIAQDVQNYQQSRRRSLIGGGDAQTLLNYFARKQLQDSDFFYTFQLDKDGRLCNVFWRDSISKLHYECFGDVMIFDTTYRTNKWNMSFAPFVGLNNHWKNVYFGCAFLHDETSLSFEWLFNSFLISMGGKQPKTLFTDQDIAMGIAIKNVFTEARHRLCEWHIEKNAAQRIPRLFSQSNFKTYFNKLLWRCKSESDFNLTWQKMIEECNVGDNSWLQRLYGLREKWCPAFSQNIFSGDIRSSQRGESANKVFSDFTCQSTTLIEFANQYEEKLAEVRDSEALDDFRTRGKPKISVRDCGILEDAVKVYTRTIFFRFQDEFLQCISDWTVLKTNEGSTETYTLTKDEYVDSYIVHVDCTKHTIVCSCHMFETLGWLCRHALRVMHLHLEFKSLPEMYILKRWTKGAKHGIMNDEDCSKDENKLQGSMTTRLNSLLRESFAVMSLAVGDDTSERIAKEHLNVARSEIIQHQNKMFSCGDVEQGASDNNKTDKYLNSKVKDPINKRRKGQRNVRLKGCLEKRRGKRSKFTNLEKLSQNTLQEKAQSSGYHDQAMAEQVFFEQVEPSMHQNVSFSRLFNKVNLEV